MRIAAVAAPVIALCLAPCWGRAGEAPDLGAAFEDARMLVEPAAAAGHGPAESVHGEQRPLLICDPTGSAVRFRGLLGKAKGVFKSYQVRAWIDPADLTRSELEVVLDMDSLSSESWLIPSALLKGALNVTRHPAGTLKTLAIKPTAQPNVFSADVDIRLKGQAYNEIISVTVERRGEDYRLAGSIAMKIDGFNASLDYDVLLRPSR